MSEDVGSLEGNIVFDVRAEVIAEEISREFFVSYLGSLDSPFGLTIGQVGKTGWYLSTKASSVYKEPPYTYSGEAWNPGFTQARYYEFSNTEKTRRLSVTAGFTWQLGQNFFLYTGAGYGIKDLLWQIDIYDYENDAKTGSEYVQQPEYSYTGIEAEGGFIVRMGSFLLEGGVTSVNLQYTNWTVGMRVAF